jgi:hypothetical protein
MQPRSGCGPIYSRSMPWEGTARTACFCPLSGRQLRRTRSRSRLLVRSVPRRTSASGRKPGPRCRPFACTHLEFVGCWLTVTVLHIGGPAQTDAERRMSPFGCWTGPSRPDGESDKTTASDGRFIIVLASFTGNRLEVPSESPGAKRRGSLSPEAARDGRDWHLVFPRAPVETGCS